MNKRGFTLIELLIVVAIIGIVAAIAIPNLLIALQKGKQKATMADMKAIGTSIEAYMADLSMVPQTADLPGTGTTWFCPFYIKVMPRADGWGNPWYYAHGVLGANGDVYSIGSGTRDNNLTSWTSTGSYLVTSLEHFTYDIIFSNGVFTYGPRVKN